MMYAHHFQIPVAIVRFFSLYGPNLRKQLLWDACLKIDNGDFHFYGSGKEIRDWLHVKDAALLFLALTSHASSLAPIVNGGTGIGTPVNEIVNEIKKIIGKTGVCQFSQEPNPGDPLGYIADIRTTISFGWKPTISLREGITEYVQWYRSGAL